MDKISKAIKNIDSETVVKLVEVLDLLLKNDLKTLDIKKLKGQKSIFRVRVGNHRIIFTKDVQIKILFIGHRNEKTYKKF